MSITWSSPDRRVGSKDLPIIAMEIYMDIFDFIIQGNAPPQIHSTLCSFTLVCRSFAAICRPHLFRTFTFSGTRFKNSKKLTSSFQFANALQDAQITDEARFLATYVRQCTIKEWDARQESRWVQTVPDNEQLNQLTTAVGQMHNLTSLTLQTTLINNALIRVIGNLKQLRSLFIQDCVFDDDITNDVILGLASLKLTALTFIDASNVSSHFKFLPSLTASLVSSHLRTLKLSAWSFAQAILSFDSIQLNLRELEIQRVEDDSLLRAFLNKESSSSIERLRIDFLYRSEEFITADSDIRPTSLPKLCSLLSPACLAQDIVTGRPLAQLGLSGVACNQSGLSVDFRRGDMTTTMLDGLKNPSAAQITSLHIPAHIFFDASVVQCFPCLETLVVDLVHRNYGGIGTNGIRIQQISACIDTVTAVVDELQGSSTAKLQNLRDLLIDVGSDGTAALYADLKEQHNLITLVVSPRLPATLKRIRFTEHVEWNRVSDGAKDIWCPAVAVEFQEEVRRNISDILDVNDFDGCFARLELEE